MRVLESVAKLPLYARTASHLRPSQVVCRLWLKLGGEVPLLRGSSDENGLDTIEASQVPCLGELDFDAPFLERFDCDALLDDRLILLHHEEQVDWRTSWHANLSTPLWQCNLHYFEYLLPLAHEYIRTGDARHVDKAKRIVASWIEHNPRKEDGWGWTSYTISLRLVNWLAFKAELAQTEAALEEDRAFVSAFNGSLYEQYLHLTRHLERDVLANHYLENLKAIAIGAIYFKDARALDAVLPLLKEQIEEQVLTDGMHFELSPMYHKVILEDILRVASFLRADDRDWEWLIPVIQRMCDCIYSFEHGTTRTPLFNDSGDNVAKSTGSLLKCAYDRFGIKPSYRNSLPQAGYYFLEESCRAHSIKLVFDAGQPGPSYAMGHAHCDALSFEVYVDGQPVISNLGTYAYQDENRLEYKSSEAHSTVHVKGVEQCECWAPFRVAGYSSTRLIENGERSFVTEMVDHAGNAIRRSIELDGDMITVRDSSPDEGLSLVETVLVANEGGCESPVSITPKGGDFEARRCEIAPEFGMRVPGKRYSLTAGNEAEYVIRLTLDGIDRNTSDSTSMPEEIE